MPMPFDRFRIINESDKDVTEAKYKWHPLPEPVNPDHALDESVSMTPQAHQSATDAPLDKWDVKNIVVTVVTVQVAANDERTMRNWQLFYPEDPADPEGNMITAVDLFVRNAPEVPDSFYAVARVTFVDGTVWDYHSPQLLEED